MRCIISVWAEKLQTIGHEKAVSSFQRDIDNLPLHIFGYHDKCLKYFCKAKQTNDKASSSSQPETQVSATGSSEPHPSTSCQPEPHPSPSSPRVPHPSPSNPPVPHHSPSRAEPQPSPASPHEPPPIPTSLPEPQESPASPQEPQPLSASGQPDLQTSAKPSGPEEEIMEIAEHMVHLHEDLCNIELLEESRGDCKGGKKELKQFIITDINRILLPIKNMAHELVYNLTTNTAEMWMSIRAKFDGGKQINRSDTHSWETRCYGASLRMNRGPMWSPATWEKTTLTPASSPFKKHFQNIQKKENYNNNPKRRKKNKTNAKRRKQNVRQVNSTKAAKSAYGVGVKQDIPDCSPSELQKLCKDYYTSNIAYSEEHVNAIEKQTRDQSHSDLWQSERLKRITATRAKQILTRKAGKPVSDLVQDVLYPAKFQNEDMRRGLVEEEETIRQYLSRKKHLKYIAEKRGLMIHPREPWLAASPDGMVMKEDKAIGLVEAKYVADPKRKEDKKQLMSIKEKAKKKKTFYLTLEGDKLSLKTSHKHYTQCQLQMEVTGTKWVDFVVRSTMPEDLEIVRVDRDEKYLKNAMSKLRAFYQNAVLPELAAPRVNCTSGIREPKGNWVRMDQILWMNAHH